MIHKNNPVIYVLALLPLFFSFCVLEPTDPFYYDKIYDKELKYCKTFLEMYFIFRDSLPEDACIYSTPESLFISVNEPYTWYVNKDLAALVWSLLTTASGVGGVGIDIDTVESKFVIIDVTPNAPGARAGLREGDTVIAVNDTGLSNYTLEQVKSYQTGITGNTVLFRIKREDVEHEINVIYGEYFKRSVKICDKSLSTDYEVAYISIELFSNQTCINGGTAQEFENALTITSWAEYTILDLRGNNGGETGQCVQIASEFVSLNTPIINARQRIIVDMIAHTASTIDSVWLALIGGLAVDRIFFVLMDSMSAGETEILISCLHSNRPDIVTFGQKSMGKGRIQTMNSTPEGGIINITSGILTSVTGENYDIIGITPKIPVPDSVDVLEAALDYISESR